MHDINVCTRVLILISTPCWDVPVHEAVVQKLDKLVSDPNLPDEGPCSVRWGQVPPPPHWFNY